MKLPGSQTPATETYDMSKFVKDLITKDLRNRLDGVEDALLVDVIGLEEQQERRAAAAAAEEEHPPAGGEEQPGARGPPKARGWRRRSRTRGGTMALIWGGEDIISLAKEVISIAEDKEYEKFTPKGGVMDGQPLAGRPGEGRQQVAQPQGAAQHFDRPDPERRRDAVGPVAQRRQQAGEPDQEEERRRRRRAAAE